MGDDRAMRILSSLRYLWRGTRQRSGNASRIPAEFAGWFVDDTGVQRSIADVRSDLAPVVGQADLSDTELLACTEFYGLYGYPADLASGAHSLVGSVPSIYGSLAKRSTVAALLASATDKIVLVLEGRPRGVSAVIEPESDPVDRGWLDSSRTTTNLTAVQQVQVIEAAYYAALSLVDRAQQARGIRAGLRNWAGSHGVVVAPDLRQKRVSFEHRRAAFAAAAVALRSILDSPEAVERILNHDAHAGWPALPIPATAMRSAQHSKYGSMTSGQMTSDDLVLAAGEIFEGISGSEQMSFAVLAEFRAGRAQRLLSEDDYLTVLWAFGRGLTAKGSWLVLDLAQWSAQTHDANLTNVSLTSWAAHVASLHLHDALSWRLANNAEQQLRSIHQSKQPTQRQRALVRFQLDLIRSGCCVREADRHNELPDKKEADEELAAARLTEAFKYVSSAQSAWTEANDPTELHPLQGMEIQLRAAEILFLAYRMRQQGNPVAEFKNERAQLERVLSRCERLLIEHPRPDDEDYAILQRRVELLQAAFSSEQTAS